MTTTVDVVTVVVAALVMFNVGFLVGVTFVLWTHR